MRFAKLSPRACRKALAKAKVPVKMVRKRVAGVALPLRLDGPLHGVKIVTARAPSKLGILDCRLALALDALAATLAKQDVSEIHIGSMYRPGAKIAGLRNKKSQHGYALAADIISLRTKSGQLLRVTKDWHAAIGQKACGPTADMTDPTPKSIALRNAICAAARQQLFHHILTPCFNKAHRDHFHLDIKRKATYHSVN